MWQAFKNVSSGTVHAVSLPSGMSPHGFAMDWGLAQTDEPLSCQLCLMIAYLWRSTDFGLNAMLPAELRAKEVRERRCRICGVPVSQCCC